MKKSLLLFCLVYSVFVSGQVTVQNLLTENLSNPIGLEVKQLRFTWQLTGSKRSIQQTAYEIKVSNGKSTVWNSGKVASDQSVHVSYKGAALQSGVIYQWQVRVWDNDGKASGWSKPASFRMGLLNPSDWKAQWIETVNEDSINRPAQYFRTIFDVKKKIASAVLYITAHGMYEAWFNGKRVGDAYLSPGWTSYDKRLQYQVYDVSDLVVSGNNATGVIVGNGWYRGHIGWGEARKSYKRPLGVLYQLQIIYTDGSSSVVVSDGNWKSSTGSIRMNEIYDGETVDAREEKLGWNTAGYSAANWGAVKVATYNNAILVSTYNEPIRKHETFKPVKIITTPKGERVIDFGQNLTGWVMVKASGKAGDQITMRHAEVLDKYGNFYIDNMRGAKTTAHYILKGSGEEQFEPHFTFYGFRYIKVDDFPGEIRPENFTAVALYSDMQPTGTFTSSHPLINQLQHNIQWGQRGNFLDVPTDCPQRDERLGWTGDAQAFSNTAAFNFRVNNFFAKWLRDVEADQKNGSVPDVIPDVVGGNSNGATGWADVGTIVPWNMYMAYGDTNILRNQYESMKAWVGYMERNSTNYLWNKGRHYGDWLFYRPFDDNDGRSAVTDKYMIAQCFFAHSTNLIIKTATVLGKNEDIDRYSKLLRNVKEAFVKEYLTPNGRLVSSTQTAYVLALNFDMLPEALRAQAVTKLVDNVKSYNNHLTTGFLGTPYLCHVLSRFGHADVAYSLLLQETYPSWLYPVKMGATTVWERWDGIKPDSTFQTPGMNSFNHYAYGAIGDWMYRVVAGIDTDPEGPGYKKIKIQPVIGKGLTKASAALDTYYGKLSSEWIVDNGRLSLNVEIPANTTATVYIPASENAGITENGADLLSIKNITVTGKEKGYTVVKVGSGSYRFVSTL